MVTLVVMVVMGGVHCIASLQAGSSVVVSSSMDTTTLTWQAGGANVSAMRGTATSILTIEQIIWQWHISKF